MDEETYLGDGLYASLDASRQIKLRAPREYGDHVVYLDGSMLLALMQEAQRWGVISKVKPE